MQNYHNLYILYVLLSTWYIESLQHRKCYIKGYLVDFTSTHAISIPVIFILVGFSYKTIFSRNPLWWHWHQKVWNFAHLLIYLKSLSRHIHLLKRPRKSLKVDNWWTVPRKSVRVGLHWFLKLHKLSFSDLSFIRWVQKSLNSWNSTYSYFMLYYQLGISNHYSMLHQWSYKGVKILIEISFMRSKRTLTPLNACEVIFRTLKYS